MAPIPGVGVVGVTTSPSPFIISSGKPGTPPYVKVMLPMSDVSAKEVLELGIDPAERSANDKREFAAVS